MTADINETSFILVLKNLLEDSKLDIENLKTFVIEKANTLKQNHHNETKAKEVASKIASEFEDFKKTKVIHQETKIRGIVDGVFDMTHFGHFNAFRQARKLCDELVVAVNGSEAVEKAKG